MLVAEADAALERLAACRKAATSVSSNGAVAAANVAAAVKTPMMQSLVFKPALDGSAAVDTKPSTHCQQLGALFPCADLQAGQKLQIAKAWEQQQVKDGLSFYYQGTMA